MSHHPMHYYQHDDRHDIETCEDCGAPATACHGDLRVWLCADCESARGEDQDEAKLAAFHGGAAAFNDVERNR